MGVEVCCKMYDIILAEQAHMRKTSGSAGAKLRQAHLIRSRDALALPCCIVRLCYQAGNRLW